MHFLCGESGGNANAAVRRYANACVMANVHWGYPDEQETSVSGGVTAVCVVFPV
jgi:hypothetical protein